MGMQFGKNSFILLLLFVLRTRSCFENQKKVPNISSYSFRPLYSTQLPTKLIEYVDLKSNIFLVLTLPLPFINIFSRTLEIALYE